MTTLEKKKTFFCVLLSTLLIVAVGISLGFILSSLNKNQNLKQFEQNATKTGSVTYERAVAGQYAYNNNAGAYNPVGRALVYIYYDTQYINSIEIKNLWSGWLQAPNISPPKFGWGSVGGVEKPLFQMTLKDEYDFTSQVNFDMTMYINVEHRPDDDEPVNYTGWTSRTLSLTRDEDGNFWGKGEGLLVGTGEVTCVINISSYSFLQPATYNLFAGSSNLPAQPEENKPYISFAVVGSDQYFSAIDASSASATPYVSGGRAFISHPYFTVTLKSGVTLNSSLYRVSIYCTDTSFQQLQTLNQYVSDGRLKTSKTPFYRNYTEYFDTVQVYSSDPIYNTVTFRSDAQWGTTKGIYVIELIDLIPEDLTPVAKPTFSGGSSFTYTSSAITPQVDNYETTYMTRLGTYQATNVGNYSITYTLKSGYCWNDDTTSDVVLTWYITKKSLRKPILRESPTYNGSEVSPSLYFFDDLLMTMSGDTSAINVNTSGTYTITITLKDTINYQWSGGGIAVVNWNVNPQSIDDGTVTPPYTDYTYDGTVKNMIHRNRYRLFLLRLQMFNR